MKTVLVVDHTTARSGGEIALAQLLRKLDKSRFRVVVALPDGDGMLAQELARTPGVKIVIVRTSRQLLLVRRKEAIRKLLTQPSMLAGVFGLVLRYVRLIKEERADIVLTNSIKSDYYASIAAAICSRRVVWYVHDVVDEHYFPLWARLSLVFTANVFASAVMCCSRAGYLALLRAGCSAAKLRVVYLPPMEDRRVMPRSDVRRGLGIRDNERIVTIVGRITPPKGQREFVQAIAVLGRWRSDVVALVVGDAVFGGIDNDYKLKLAKDAQGVSAVRLLGTRADAIDIMAASDVVVLASLWPEGLPLTVCEAMQHSRCVVASAVGGVTELIENEVTGLTVNAGDIKGMADAIERVLANDTLRSRLGAAAQQRVGALLSNANVRCVEDILDPSQNADAHVECGNGRVVSRPDEVG
jgi:glycosyltransferase involved in cell wall biosynthesis